MLMLLEEGAAHTEAAASSSAAGLSFSSSAARLGGGLSQLLAGRPATHVSFCDTDGRLLLTAHSAVSGSEQGPADGGPEVSHGPAAIPTTFRWQHFVADLSLSLFMIFRASRTQDQVSGIYDGA